MSTDHGEGREVCVHLPAWAGRVPRQHGPRLRHQRGEGRGQAAQHHQLYDRQE